MTSSATPKNEQMLLQVALQGTEQHVEQLVRKYRRAKYLTDDRRAESQYDARELNCYFDDDGMLVLRGRMTPEDGAVFMKALEAMIAAQSPAVACDDVSASLSEKTFPQKRVDAFLALAEQAMNTMKERLQPLSSATAIRLCCDASSVPVLKDSSGNVLNVGRKTRAFAPAIRRALQIRDRGCRFPGCCQSRYVDAHHVQLWCAAGAARLDNLVSLCRHHHRVLRQKGYEIVKHGEHQFEFLTPVGGALPAVLVPQFAAKEDMASETLAIEREHDGVGPVIDSSTAVTRRERGGWIMIWR
jgi:hypothetical protein